MVLGVWFLGLMERPQCLQVASTWEVVWLGVAGGRWKWGSRWRREEGPSRGRRWSKVQRLTATGLLWELQEGVQDVEGSRGEKAGLGGVRRRPQIGLSMPFGMCLCPKVGAQAWRAPTRVVALLGLHFEVLRCWHVYTRPACYKSINRQKGTVVWWDATEAWSRMQVLVVRSEWSWQIWEIDWQVRTLWLN